jgi:hypothetical protein
LFVPGGPGGPGRPKVTPEDRAIRAKREEWLATLDKDVPAILKGLVARSLKGDNTAAKMLLDRVLPISTAHVDALMQELEELRQRLDAIKPRAVSNG